MWFYAQLAQKKSWMVSRPWSFANAARPPISSQRPSWSCTYGRWHRSASAFWGRSRGRTPRPRWGSGGRRTRWGVEHAGTAQTAYQAGVPGRAAHPGAAEVSFLGLESLLKLGKPFSNDFRRLWPELPILTICDQLGSWKLVLVDLRQKAARCRRRWRTNRFFRQTSSCLISWGWGILGQ